MVVPRPPPQELRDLADGGEEEEEDRILRLVGLHGVSLTLDGLCGL
jgi:hypothetical protein